MSSKPRLSYLIKQVQAALRSQLERRVRSLDLTLAQYTVMSRLAARSPVSSAELARFHWVAPQTMNEIVSTLERTGLITRTEDPGNGRILLISLTDKGRDLLVDCDGLVDELEADLFASLNATEQKTLYRTLAKLVSAINDREHGDAGARSAASAGANGPTANT